MTIRIIIFIVVSGFEGTPASMFNLGGQPSFNQPQQPASNRFPEPQFGGFRPVKKRHSNPDRSEDRTGRHHGEVAAAKHSTRHPIVPHARNAKAPRHSSLRPAQSRHEYALYKGAHVAQSRLDNDDEYSDYYSNKIEQDNADYYYYYEYYD